jgi:hypothetical protein
MGPHDRMVQPVCPVFVVSKPQLEGLVYPGSRPVGRVAQMVEWRIFPSSPRRGGCAIKKVSRSILSSRRRGGVQQNSPEFDHHPVRSKKEASQYFVEVASTTPPRRGGENYGLCVSAQIPTWAFWQSAVTARCTNSTASPHRSGTKREGTTRGSR